MDAISLMWDSETQQEDEHFSIQTLLWKDGSIGKQQQQQQQQITKDNLIFFFFT